MTSTPSTTTPPTVTSAAVEISLDHPRLIRTDPESIRSFLRRYDQYSTTVLARANQLTKDNLTSEAIRPVELKFCVDAEWLESRIALGFLKEATDYATLTDDQVRAFLDKRCKESKKTVTLEQLDRIVAQKLRTNMGNRDAEARMEDLFTDYHTLLQRSGLGWLIKDNPKIAVYHVLSAIRPQNLADRLTADLSFGEYELRKDFKGFLSHAIDLAKAFQKVDSGPPARTGGGGGSEQPSAGPGRNGGRGGGRGRGRGGGGGRGRGGGGGNTTNDGNNGSSPGGDGNQSGGPICLWEPHRTKGIRHLLKDCSECPAAEKHALLSKHAEERSHGGPAAHTRSKTQTPTLAPATNEPSGTPKTARRLHQPISAHTSPSCPVEVFDGPACHTGVGRCDDGSDETIASPSMAQAAVLKGIGRMTSIAPVRIQVALRDSGEPAAFTFSRVWTVPRLVLKLSAGHMALLNVSLMVADDETACEDILLGLPLLRHLGIDTRTLLERRWQELTNTDCAGIDDPTKQRPAGRLGRLMVARLQSRDEPTTSPLDPDRPRADYFAHQADADPFPDPFLLQTEDPASDDAEARVSIVAMLDKAKANGFPDDHWEELESLVWKHAAEFRTSFSSEPARVEPLRIELMPDAKPVRVKLRNYSASQRAFLQKLVATLTAHGLVYPNPTSKWACAPLLVPKPGPEAWRFTVDLRPVNRYTYRHQYPMPLLEQELPKTAKSKFFANFDFVHSYWQLLLHPDSQESQSIITPDGVISPTRVPHGTTNAVTHLQSSIMMTLPDALKDSLLLWLDDCLLHSPTIPRFLDCIRRFLAYCAEYNWKLHPAKCILFTHSVRWCGRVISAEGIRHDPSSIDSLLSMERPTTGGQLQMFLCAMQWLRSSIPRFQSLVEPLHHFMESVYNHVGRRTKRAVGRVSLHDIGWTPALSDAFAACKDAIAARVTLAHRDESKRLCIYTDASDSHWSGIVTQVPIEDLSKPHAEQPHEPLAFHSGRFSATELGWSTLEKEAYAVLASVERSHWLAACPAGFDLFTDHNNIIFLFDPTAIMPDIGQGTLRKVLRWAVRMSAYNYCCIHIRGEDNIWADLLTRWAIPLTIRRLVSIPPLPTTFHDFVWPTPTSLRASQLQHAASRPASAVLIGNLWHMSDSGPIWVPDEDTDLQLRLAVIAHTGAAGHRGRKATETALTSHYSWTTLSEDIGLFVRSCIHCLSTTGGETVPRPYGPALHGSTPNALLQFDYIEMGLGSTGDKYILMLRDDHSGYTWFYPTDTTSAETAAHALLDWCAAFGAPKQLMSDGPSHFKNDTLRLLAKGLRSPHHFTLPYCPWSNGAIERLGKELLRVARSLLSELQQQPSEWPQLVPLFQSAINNSPSPQRDNVAPITAFTGRPPSPPISTFLQSADSAPVTISAAQRERSFNLDLVVREMDELHPLVEKSLTQQRNRMRVARQKGDLANFREGDYVLVAREQFHEGEKLCLRWRGPRRVTSCMNDYSFQVEDLRNGELQVVHGTRLKFYADDSLDADAILSHVLASETGMLVSRLLRLVEQDDQLCVLVRWKGLEDTEDTLEPLQRVHEDVPQLLAKLLRRKNTNARLRSRACAELGLEEGVCTDPADLRT